MSKIVVPLVKPLVVTNKQYQPLLTTAHNTTHVNIYTNSNIVLLLSVEATATMSIQTASYLATTPHFHGNAIKSNYREKVG